MKLARKTEKRTKLLDRILDVMKKNEFFSDEISRGSDSENQIQRVVFSRLEMELVKILPDVERINADRAKAKIHDSFAWEKKKNVNVPNFPFFGTNHRPDAVLTIDDIRIAFEIKKGHAGDTLRAGIGQAVVYSTQFDFVLYFFVDTTKARDIRNSLGAKKENQLVHSLWENYNVRFVVV